MPDLTPGPAPVPPPRNRPCGYVGVLAERRPHPNFVCAGCGEVVVVGRNPSPVEFARHLRAQRSRVAHVCPTCGAPHCPACRRGGCKAGLPRRAGPHRGIGRWWTGDDGADAERPGNRARRLRALALLLALVGLIAAAPTARIPPGVLEVAAVLGGSGLVVWAWRRAVPT